MYFITIIMRIYGMLYQEINIEKYWNSKNSKNFLRSGDMNTLMYKVRLLEKDKRDVQKK